MPEIGHMFASMVIGLLRAQKLVTADIQVEANLVSLSDAAGGTKLKALAAIAEDDTDQLFVCHEFQGDAFELLQRCRLW